VVAGARADGPSASSSASFTFAYDGTNRRINQTATDNSWWNYPTASGVGATTTVYVTDADNREVLEYSGTGALQNWYAFGLGPDEALNQMNVAAGIPATLIPDVIGSIVGSLDSGGTLTKFGYQTFGENPSLISAATATRGAVWIRRPSPPRRSPPASTITAHALIPPPGVVERPLEAPGASTRSPRPPGKRPIIAGVKLDRRKKSSMRIPTFLTPSTLAVPVSIGRHQEMLRLQSVGHREDDRLTGRVSRPDGCRLSSDAPECRLGLCVLSRGRRHGECDRASRTPG
jgi:hypothetical protein